MAKFVTDDGKDGISGDKFMDELRKNSSIDSYPDMFINTHIPKRHIDVEKLKCPAGRRNRDRLLNLNMYDMLVHIQQTLSLNNRCIIEMITNESHRCINMNDSIINKIHQFAKAFIDDDFKKENPKQKIRYKTSEDGYDFRDETDEEWYDRLCHMYMHGNHPAKLQMFKCEECLQHWMNSEEW